ncbi:TPA: pentapeptide repeat-containing protein [Campylobacter coli]|nr:pentapeptide repeat-containing protein [Campylobacter coli]
MNNIQYNAIAQCNIIFSECNISLSDKQSENNRIVKTNLYFYNCTFEKSLNLKNIIFEKTLTFNQCAFYNDLDMHQNQFLDHLVFINCSNEQNDKKIISLDLKENEFKGYLFIKNCTIEKINLWKNKFKNRCYFVDSKFGYKDKDNQAKLNFSNTHFEDEVYFNNSEFYNYADFHECKFEDNTYFNNSHFKDYVDFCECEFDNIACFYGVKFDKTPNFSQAIFKGNLNVVNTNLNFTFDNLEEKIKQEYGSYKSQRIAKEAGVIPNLYQEKSLDKFANDFRDSFRNFKSTLIKDNNLLDASNFHKYELYCKELELKNKKDKTLKDRIDKWQLSFYHKLCDHHTDILQSLNSLILVIGIFVLSSVAMVVDFNYRLGYKPILEHWYFSLDFYNHHINSIIQDNYLFVVKVNFAMLFGYLILVGFALCLKCIRGFFIIISYGVTLLVLVVSPKILIPAMGFFTDKRTMLDPLSTMGGIYTIVFGFVVFSFIKTIRKNSIVPS